jgi:glycosyltransferase involved in cell wall biosynthesis
VKVLFVASGNKTGQPGAVVQNQAKSLTDAGIELDFYLVIGKGLKGYLKNIYPLFKHLKNNKYDIIHSHYSLSAFITTITLWFTPCKVHVVSLMGSDTKLKGVFKRLVKIGCNSFWSKTIVKSRQMLEDSGLKKAVVIPNGVDLRKIGNIQKKITDSPSAGKEKSRPVVLFAADPGRVSKNYALAEQSMQNIPADLKAVNNLPHEELIAEIFNSDVVLSTSLWEGSPNLIKEAMACNCPVVSTRVGDVEWLFGQTEGYYITTFEPEDVSVKIIKALEFAANNGRTRGKERILEIGLDSDSVAGRIILLYREALEYA